MSKQLSFYLSTIQIQRAMDENKKPSKYNVHTRALLEKLEKNLPELIQAARLLEMRAAMANAMFVVTKNADGYIESFLAKNPEYAEKLTKEFHG